MKTDKTKIKLTSELPSDCEELIKKILNCQTKQVLYELLAEVKYWSFGKSELGFWVDVLDKLDDVLADACEPIDGNPWRLNCDSPTFCDEDKCLLKEVLRFLALLVEHSFGRQVFSSTDHLTTLLHSETPSLTISALNILFSFSKRSSFVMKLEKEQKRLLIHWLLQLSEGWGGSASPYSLTNCCQYVELSRFPASATTMTVQYYPRAAETADTNSTPTQPVLQTQTIEHVDEISKPLGAIMLDLIEEYNIKNPLRQIQLFCRLRLARHFPNYLKRLELIQCKLLALNVLVYSKSIPSSSAMYLGHLVNEMVDMLKLDEKQVSAPIEPLPSGAIPLLETQASSLKLLTALVQNEEPANDHRTTVISHSQIIEATGASSCHGLLPTLCRKAIKDLLDDAHCLSRYGSYVSALFSFHYHLANFEAGAEALLSSGAVPQFLKLFSWKASQHEHVTYVTRAVRVIDLLCDLDMNPFIENDGLRQLLDRIAVEGIICEREQPYIIEPVWLKKWMTPSSPRLTIGDLYLLSRQQDAQNTAVAPNIPSTPATTSSGQSDNRPPETNSAPTTSDSETADDLFDGNVEDTFEEYEKRYLNYFGEYYSPAKLHPEQFPPAETSSPPPQCSQQRMALLKSMLSFVKEIFVKYIRLEATQLLDAGLIRALRHIISNCDYYGPTVFLNAVDFITQFVYQGPSLLSSMQENGLTNALFFALLIKNIPPTKDVIGFLPNIFSALCLNNAGLDTFIKCDAFDRMTKFLLTTEYLPAMRKHSTRELGYETAKNLGSSMDDMMRHQPAIRKSSIKSLIMLLHRLCFIGHSKFFECCSSDVVAMTNQSSVTIISGGDAEIVTASNQDQLSINGIGNDESRQISIDEADDSSQMVTSTFSSHATTDFKTGSQDDVKGAKKSLTNLNKAFNGLIPTPPVVLPIADFIANAMRFVEALLVHANATEYREFIQTYGTRPFIRLLSLRNLPISFGWSQPALCIGSVCRAITHVSKTTTLMVEVLKSINDVVDNKVKPWVSSTSMLLEYHVDKNRFDPPPDKLICRADVAPSLDGLSVVHTHLLALMHMLKVDSKPMLYNTLTSELGKTTFENLCNLYVTSVWETSLMLARLSEITAESNGHVLKCATEEETAERIREVAIIRLILSVLTKLSKLTVDFFTTVSRQGIQQLLNKRRPAAAPELSSCCQKIWQSVARVMHVCVSKALPEDAPYRAILAFRHSVLAGLCSVLLFDEKKKMWPTILQHWFSTGCPDHIYQCVVDAIDISKKHVGNCDQIVLSYVFPIQPIMSLAIRVASNPLDLSSADNRGRTIAHKADKYMLGGWENVCDSGLSLLDKLANVKQLAEIFQLHSSFVEKRPSHADISKGVHITCYELCSYFLSGVLSAESHTNTEGSSDESVPQKDQFPVLESRSIMEHFMSILCHLTEYRKSTNEDLPDNKAEAVPDVMINNTIYAQLLSMGFAEDVARSAAQTVDGVSGETDRLNSAIQVAIREHSNPTDSAAPTNKQEDVNESSKKPDDKADTSTSLFNADKNTPSDDDVRNVVLRSIDLLLKVLDARDDESNLAGCLPIQTLVNLMLATCDSSNQSDTSTSDKTGSGESVATTSTTPHCSRPNEADTVIRNVLVSLMSQLRQCVEAHLTPLVDTLPNFSTMVSARSLLLRRLSRKLHLFQVLLVEQPMLLLRVCGIHSKVPRQCLSLLHVLTTSDTDADKALNGAAGSRYLNEIANVRSVLFVIIDLWECTVEWLTARRHTLALLDKAHSWHYAVDEGQWEPLVPHVGENSARLTGAKFQQQLDDAFRRGDSKIQLPNVHFKHLLKARSSTGAIFLSFVTMTVSTEEPTPAQHHVRVHVPLEAFGDMPLSSEMLAKRQASADPATAKPSRGSSSSKQTPKSSPEKNSSSSKSRRRGKHAERQKRQSDVKTEETAKTPDKVAAAVAGSAEDVSHTDQTKNNDVAGSSAVHNPLYNIKSAFDITDRQGIVRICFLTISKKIRSVAELTCVSSCLLCLLRYTQDWILALHFASLGGYVSLLRLGWYNEELVANAESNISPKLRLCRSRMQTLGATLMRHLIEDDPMQRYVVECVLANVAKSMKKKETPGDLHYRLSVMFQPLLVKNPAVVTEVISKYLKLEPSATREEHSGLFDRIALTLAVVDRKGQPQSFECPPINQHAQKLIKLLLDLVPTAQLDWVISAAHGNAKVNASEQQQQQPSTNHGQTPARRTVQGGPSSGAVLDDVGEFRYPVRRVNIDEVDAIEESSSPDWSNSNSSAAVPVHGGQSSSASAGVFVLPDNTMSTSSGAIDATTANLAGTSNDGKTAATDSSAIFSPLFDREQILLILAEFSRNYPIVSVVVASHSYTSKTLRAGESILPQHSQPVSRLSTSWAAIESVTTKSTPSQTTSGGDGSTKTPAISFLLDQCLVYKLPVVNAEQTSKETTGNNSSSGNELALNVSLIQLIVSLASFSVYPMAQLEVVTALRFALRRALSSGESYSKHVQIQSIINTFGTIIEQVPGTVQWPSQNGRNQQPKMVPSLSSPLIGLMTHRNVIAELAQSLKAMDLSSPWLPGTANLLIRLLDLLVKRANDGAQWEAAKASKKKDNSEDAASGSAAGRPGHQSTTGRSARPLSELISDAVTDGSSNNATNPFNEGRLDFDELLSRVGFDGDADGQFDDIMSIMRRTDDHTNRLFEILESRNILPASSLAVDGDQQADEEYVVGMGGESVSDFDDAASSDDDQLNTAIIERQVIRRGGRRSIIPAQDGVPLNDDEEEEDDDVDEEQDGDDVEDASIGDDNDDDVEDDDDDDGGNQSEGEGEQAHHSMIAALDHALEAFIGNVEGDGHNRNDDQENNNNTTRTIDSSNTAATASNNVSDVPQLEAPGAAMNETESAERRSTAEGVRPPPLVEVVLMSEDDDEDGAGGDESLMVDTLMWPNSDNNNAVRVDDDHDMDDHQSSNGSENDDDHDDDGGDYGDHSMVDVDDDDDDNGDDDDDDDGGEDEDVESVIYEDYPQLPAGYDLGVNPSMVQAIDALFQTFQQSRQDTNNNLQTTLWAPPIPVSSSLTPHINSSIATQSGNHMAVTSSDANFLTGSDRSNVVHPALHRVQNRLPVVHSNPSGGRPMPLSSSSTQRLDVLFQSGANAALMQQRFVPLPPTRQNAGHWNRYVLSQRQVFPRQSGFVPPELFMPSLGGATSSSSGIGLQMLSIPSVLIRWSDEVNLIKQAAIAHLINAVRYDIVRIMQQSRDPPATTKSNKTSSTQKSKARANATTTATESTEPPSTVANDRVSIDVVRVRGNDAEEGAGAAPSIDVISRFQGDTQLVESGNGIGSESQSGEAPTAPARGPPLASPNEASDDIRANNDDQMSVDETPPTSQQPTADWSCDVAPSEGGTQPGESTIPEPPPLPPTNNADDTPTTNTTTTAMSTGNNATSSADSHPIDAANNNTTVADDRSNTNSPDSVARPVVEESTGAVSVAQDAVSIAETPSVVPQTSTITTESSVPTTVAEDVPPTVQPPSSSRTNDEPSLQLDPSFLAALPSDIRREVIEDYYRQQRVRQQQRDLEMLIAAREQPAAVPATVSSDVAPAADAGAASNVVAASTTSDGQRTTTSEPTTTSASAPVSSTLSSSAAPTSSTAAPLINIAERLSAQPDLLEVSEEFLSALPAEIRAEVLAQQQTERQRLESERARQVREANAVANGGTGEASNATAGNAASQPEADDPAAFVNSLPDALRRTVLMDMDPSQIESLPPAIQQEARRLHRGFRPAEAHVSVNGLLRQLGYATGGQRHSTIRMREQTSIPRSRGRGIGMLSRSGAIRGGHSSTDANNTILSLPPLERVAQPLVDTDGLACIILLLFCSSDSCASVAAASQDPSSMGGPTGEVAAATHQQQVAWGQLHRLLVSLSTHAPTRQWIIDALVSLLDVCSRENDAEEMSVDAAESTTGGTSSSSQRQKTGWLNIGQHSALEGTTRVFVISRGTGKTVSFSVSIHSQAAAFVMQQTLHALIALAQVYPDQFFDVDVAASTANDSVPSFWETINKLDKSVTVEFNEDSNRTSNSVTASPFIFCVSPNDKPLSTSDSPSKRSLQRNATSQSTAAASSTTLNSVSSVQRKGDPSSLGQSQLPFYKLLKMLSMKRLKSQTTLVDQLLQLLVIPLNIFNYPIADEGRRINLIRSNGRRVGINSAVAAADNPLWQPLSARTGVNRQTGRRTTGTATGDNRTAIGATGTSGGSQTTQSNGDRRQSTLSRAPSIFSIDSTITSQSLVATLESSVNAPRTEVCEESTTAVTSEATLTTMDITEVDSGAKQPVESSEVTKSTAAHHNDNVGELNVQCDDLYVGVKSILDMAVERACGPTNGLDVLVDMLKSIANLDRQQFFVVIHCLVEGIQRIGRDIECDIDQLSNEVDALVGESSQSPSVTVKAADGASTSQEKSATPAAASSNSADDGAMNETFTYDGDTATSADHATVTMAGTVVIGDRFTNDNAQIVLKGSAKNRAGAVGSDALRLPSLTRFTGKAAGQKYFLKLIQLLQTLLTNQTAEIAARESAEAQLETVKKQRDEMEKKERELQAREKDLKERKEALEIMKQNYRDVAAGKVEETTSQPQEQTGSTSESAQPPAEAAKNDDADKELVVMLSKADTSNDDIEAIQTAISTNFRFTKSDACAPMCQLLLPLDSLWRALSRCLTLLQHLPSKTNDHSTVLTLQPTVEAFFLVHSSSSSLSQTLPSSSSSALDAATASSSAKQQHISQAGKSTDLVPLQDNAAKFLRFAEQHRVVLNHILRQAMGIGTTSGGTGNTSSANGGGDGPSGTAPSPATFVLGPGGTFNVLTEHARLLDFDVKRKYFRQCLDMRDMESVDWPMGRRGGVNRREDKALRIKRNNVFEDSFALLFHAKPEDWKQRFYIMFDGEEGQDAGGLQREWYIIIAREIFNPNYALFSRSSGDRGTYTINPLSHCHENHLQYFKFVGCLIAKAIYEGKLLDCYFTRSFYKHILAKPVSYSDMEAEDYSFYQSLVYLLETDISKPANDLELTFSTDIQEFGVNTTKELKENGANIAVTEQNKKEYVNMVCQMKMTGAIKHQLDAVLQGFYSIIPRDLISIFNEQELELLISGLPTIDIEDLQANTEYHKYQRTCLQVVWFWQALRSFDQAELARFVQFVTGTSKVPLGGFAMLEGMQGPQKFQIHRDDRSTRRLPCAHTCFNQLDLPVYESYDKLREMLLIAINEGSEGFGFA